MRPRYEEVVFALKINHRRIGSRTVGNIVGCPVVRHVGVVDVDRVAVGFVIPFFRRGGFSGSFFGVLGCYCTDRQSSQKNRQSDEDECNRFVVYHTNRIKRDD